MKACKLGQVRTKTISEAVEADLDAAVLVFAQSVGEDTIVDYRFAASDGFFSVCILYMK